MPERKTGSRDKWVPLSQREGHESFLVEWAIQNEVSLWRIAQDLEVYPSSVYDLAYGKRGPLHRNGKIKPLVARLSEYTGLDLHVLFPRDFCPLRKLENEQLDTRIRDLHFQAHDPERIDEIIYAKQIARQFFNCPKIKDSDKQLVYDVYVCDMRMSEVAATVGRSDTRIQQRILKALRVFRAWMHGRSVARKNMNEVWLQSTQIETFCKIAQAYLDKHYTPCTNDHLWPEAIIPNLLRWGRKINRGARHRLPYFTMNYHMSDLNNLHCRLIPFNFETTRKWYKDDAFATLLLARNDEATNWYGTVIKYEKLAPAGNRPEWMHFDGLKLIKDSAQVTELLAHCKPMN